MMQHCDFHLFHLFHDPRVFTCLTCLTELIAICTPQKRAIVREDKFPGVHKIIELVNMMFILILIIKMCYSWMCFLSF